MSAGPMKLHVSDGLPGGPSSYPTFTSGVTEMSSMRDPDVPLDTRNDRTENPNKNEPTCLNSF